MTESLHNPRPSWCPHSFPEQGLKEEEVQGQSRWYHRGPPDTSPAHSPACSPPQWQGEEAELDLGSPPVLEPNVERFFCSPVGEGDEEGHLPVEPPVGEHEEWIKWRWQVVDTLNWW